MARDFYNSLEMKQVNIDDMPYGQLKQIAALFRSQQGQDTSGGYDNGMIGRYVIVRCHDAGVHAGVLESHHGRECVLQESRWLWRWIPKKGAWLSGIAVHGLHPDSKIGCPVRVHLTEICQIIACSPEAEKSIREIASYEPD